MKTSKADFPTFFEAYLVAALWSSTITEGAEDDPGEREGDPFDKHFSTSDFTDEALETMRAHAFSFWCRMWYYIDHEKAPVSSYTEPRNATQAGHDFWLTQNGHGAGFWDGDWPTYGEQFTKLSKCYPEINLYVTPENQVGVE
jgi:hypothetical protein